MRQSLYLFIIRRFLKTEEGMTLTRMGRVIWSCLFPLKALYYKVAEKEGYQPISNTWIIHGMRFSDDAFLLMKESGTFKVAERNGGITFTKIHGK